MGRMIGEVSVTILATLFLTAGTALAAGGGSPDPTVIAEKLGIAADGRILVSELVIDGNSALGTPELLDVVASYTNRELAPKDVGEAVAALTTHYRSRGFPYAAATVPDQRVAGGVLALRILEGRVREMKLQGNRSYGDAFLANRLSHLAAGSVITQRAYERGTILMNTLPGVKAQIAVQPAGEEGLFDVVVALKEDRLQGSLGADNYIQTDFGPWQAKARLTLNNPTRQGDTLFVEPSVLQDRWPNGVYGGYERPLGGGGASLKLQYLKADFQFLTQSPLMGLQNNISYTIAQVSVPLRLGFQSSVILNTGYVRSVSDYVFEETGFLLTETLNLWATSVLVMHGRQGAAMTSAFVQFSTSFKRNPDGVTDHGEPARLDLVAGHERWFTPKLSLFLFGIGILSYDPLLSSQKVTIGGPFCVRGYGVNEAVGDQGYLVKTELRRQIPLHGATNMQVRLTFDNAQVFSKRPDTSGRDSEFLSSAGAGFTLSHSGRYSLALDYAHPLNDHPVRDGKKSGRVWASVGASF